MPVVIEKPRPLTIQDAIEFLAAQGFPATGINVNGEHDCTTIIVELKFIGPTWKAYTKQAILEMTEAIYPGG